MLRFSEKLVSLRESLGFKSARAFYLHLADRAELEFNYSYYARIEKGAVLPSEKVVSTIAAQLSKSQAESLVLAFCETLFPRFNYLFQPGSDAVAMLEKPPTAPNTLGSTAQNYPGLKQQKTLSHKQIHALSQTREHYFLFSILIMSREWITLGELKEYFNPKTLNQVIEDLRAAKILVREGDRVFNTIREVRFPVPDEGLKKIYAQIDAWEIDLTNHYKFEKLYERSLVRRISPRFVPLILEQAKQAMNLTLMAEETDPRLNDEVIQFAIKITKGKVPG